MAQAELEDIENVLIFVSDSLRWDFLPEHIESRGVAFKTVAQSTYSPPSFATLSTGLYPPQHGIHKFGDRLADGVRTTYQVPDIDATYHNEGRFRSDPLYPMFGVTQPNTVADLSPPFWYLERDTTTHAPYIEDAFVHGTDVESYFDERGSDWRRIKQDYQQTIRDSFELLEKRLRILDRLDILDDTLVVFTADHGELFGEYGNVLHVAPVCPELVYVPTVFIHPSLTADSFAVNPASEVIEHVDVITTCLEAIGRGDAVSTEGSNMFETRRNHEFGYNHVHVERGDRVFYSTGSIWWSDGGYADFDNPRALRAAFFLYHLLRNPARATLRENLPESAIPFLESHRRFGRTPITDSEANQLLNEVESSFTVAESDSMTMDDEMREKLQNLGYLN